MTVAFKVRNIYTVALAPDQFTGLQLWFKADAIGSLVDADPVATWADSSGNARDVTQATGVNQPSYRTSVINSLPAVRFDGGDRLDTASLTSIFSASGATFFIVQKQNAAQADNTTLHWPATSSTNQVIAHLSVGNTLYFDHGARDGGGRISAAQPAGWDDAFHLTTMYRSGGVGRVWVDGTLAVSGTFTDDLDPTASAVLRIGGEQPNSKHFSGDMAEIAIFNRALAYGERRSIQQHLAAKYALTVV